VFPTPVGVDQIRLDMIGYRPRRRAVLKCTITVPPRVLYVKVLRERLFESVKQRHELLIEAGVPAPVILAATSDHLLVLDELPGRPLARAIFDEDPPTTAERLIRVLDAMPASVAALERRPPWAEAVKHYARMVSQALPPLQPRLDWMAEQITQGLDDCPEGNEPTHGDFHEGQIHVRNGHVSGILDIDTVGPGRRADDLACLVAHLSTVQRMNTRQAERVHHLLRTWVPVFDERVDPTELRLRAAAVIISLATGPYRSQEPHWERETHQIVDAAEALIRQVV
jgi:Ser/Thr protein kinase RdoA (MazF antagonist)